MPSYTITNTAGAPVATIGVATTTGSLFPIELIGQGISLYGPLIGTTQYRMLENFTNNVAPSNPVIGMNWYDNTNDEFNYYDGTSFVTLGSLSTNNASLFPMLSSAQNIDLTTAASTAIFTDPNQGDTYHATGLMLKVRGTPTSTTPALVNLFVSSSEDVMENVSVNLPDATKHGYYIIQGTTHVATGGDTIMLEVTNPATGGVLDVDAYLFGFKT